MILVYTNLSSDKKSRTGNYSKVFSKCFTVNFRRRDEMEFKRSLWRSPELLRITNPPARGTQKGDVYSFGIVLFEIIGRNGPWGVTNLSNESKKNIFSRQIIMAFC